MSMFITLEGIEGSGKTTQIQHMVRFLESRGYECMITRQPGGTEIGKKIRSIVLDPENQKLFPWAELLLYMADRAQHIEEMIKPALAKGITVVCDRYFDASLVYQGYARGLDIKRIKLLHEVVLDNLKPDLTFLLDLPPETGLARAWDRINGSKTEKDTRFEEEDLVFHQRVREGYLEIAGLEPGRYRVIRAGGEEAEVKNEILDHLSRAVSGTES